MGKMKPNKFDLAIKQLAAVEKERGLQAGTLTAKIAQELEEKDCKNHYHVALVKVIHDSKNRRYVSSVTVQTFGKGPAFEKLGKNYKTLGYSHAIVLHDPTVGAKEDPADLVGFEKNAIKTRIEKEEEEAKQKRIAERVKEEEDKAKTEKAEQQKKDAKAAADAKKKQAEALEFDGVKITEENVDQFAKDNKVDISAAKSAEGKLALVKKFIDDKNKN